MGSLLSGRGLSDLLNLREPETIRGIHRVQKKTATGSRRGAWGDAGVTQNTTPFM